MLETEGTVGLLKTTAVNFPGLLATAVFLPGCNLRCGYCYNAELAKSDGFGKKLGSSTSNTYVNLTEVAEHLKKRRNVLKGLVISGGEPCISPLLEPLLELAKTLNYTVKLDTNGLFPERLKNCLVKYNNISFIALDVKTSFERYTELLPARFNSDTLSIETNLKTTINLLDKYQKTKKINYEVRTVLVPGLVGETEIKKIAEHLPANATWRFSSFLPGNCLNSDFNKIIPLNDKVLLNLVELAKTFVPNSQLR